MPESIPQILTVSICSFSYKDTPAELVFPRDSGGHGGGYVFDCRCLPNPGREERYREATGLDSAVKHYLEALPEVQDFRDQTSALVTFSVERYLARGFTSLFVAFGCTGGQHRSVYMTESLSDFLTTKYSDTVRTTTTHLNLLAKGMLQ